MADEQADDFVSSLKQDKQAQQWSLPIRLEKIRNSLRLDGKEWMADSVDEALRVLVRQKRSLTAQQEKLQKQRENLRAYRKAALPFPPVQS